MTIAGVTVAWGAERTRNVPVLFMQDYGYVFIEHHTVNIADAVFCMEDGFDPQVTCLKVVRKADPKQYGRVGWWTTAVEAEIVYEEET